MSRTCIAILILASVLACAASADLPGMKRDMTYKKGDGFVDVLRDKQLVARYVYTGAPKPFFYPVISPAGEKATRGFPMDKIAGEAQDHPHQRSFWIGYGDVNGVDFWTEGPKSGKIVQTSLDFQPASPGYWAIHTKNDWIGPDGSKICEDERHISFLSCDYGTVISTLITLTAGNRPVKLGDTKEGFFAVRVAQGMQVKDCAGTITYPDSELVKEGLGRRARWCDYTGKVNGRIVGITLFDSAWNYGYPTYWLAEDYGLLAANPFGGAALSGDPKKSSGLTIAAYDSRSFVFLALIHDGAFDPDTINSFADQMGGRGSGIKSRNGGSPDQPKPALPTSE